MAEKFSLKDHLFNPDTVAVLGAGFARALPGFDAAAFQARALAGFDSRELMQRIEWLADCLEPDLAGDFDVMAGQIEAALPEPLDPNLRDDDFGHFIWAVPGVLIARHGLETDPSRALDLLGQATKRFSMEFYIRPFLNRWPDLTLERLHIWADDPNYHVRRLVSEGTRPRLPWGKAVTIGTDETLPLLDRLHGDPTRFVTRSVANHLNDITRHGPDRVMDRLEDWAKSGQQSASELGWMRSHALRNLIKAGNPRAMRLIGFDPALKARVALDAPETARIGQDLTFTAEVTAPAGQGVLVDYALHVTRADGSLAPKVFKLKKTTMPASGQLTVQKRHKLKSDATTFTLRPGKARIELMVNGVVRAAADLELTG